VTQTGGSPPLPGGGATSYGDSGFSGFLRGAFLAGGGRDKQDLDRPLIGITDTTSDYNPCHRQMPQIVESVKRGVLEAGGLPMVFPTASLGEILLSPTSMYYRNLLAMETEELIGAQPMHAAVLLGGCDKTVPAQLMAAASSDVPVILEVTGPMLTNTWRGERLGACTDCRRMWARHRAGELDDTEIAEVEGALATTPGTCMVMGTASTMATMAETLGMMLPGGATPPSATGERLRHATATGRQAVALARQGVPARAILTQEAFGNALLVLAAIGGSTNAIVHMLAIARRAGVSLTLDDFEAAAQRVPLLLDLKPSGSGYMEDFHRAGGVPVLLRGLRDLLDGSTVGVSGVSLAELTDTDPAPPSWQSTIRSLDKPLGPAGSLAVLHGSLAPDGAVIKVSAATPEMLVHTGPAVVFESAQDAVERLDDPSLPITKDSVLVLRNSGPVGAGMPEAGSLPIPRRLATEGVRDMVRVSDARMSGTSYGTVVLHCAPESAVGGPLGLVRDGDLIELDVPARTINLLVSEDVLRERRADLTGTTVPERGWKRLYAEHVMQANHGADLDFM
jgi:dihydroxy-acid dehydratase